MQLVTRKLIAKEIGHPFITLQERILYISKPAAHRMFLKPGDRVHFMNEDAYWQVSKTSDPEGWLVSEVFRKNAGLQITAMVLSRMIAKSMNIPQPTRLMIFDTKREFKGHKVFELKPA